MNGFSIVEVMIVVAIIVMFSSIVAFGGDKFSDRASRVVIAYDLALGINLARSLAESGKFVDDAPENVPNADKDDAYFCMTADERGDNFSKEVYQIKKRTGCGGDLHQEYQVVSGKTSNELLKICKGDGCCNDDDDDDGGGDTEDIEGETFYIHFPGAFGEATIKVDEVKKENVYFCVGNDSNTERSIIKVDPFGRASVQ